MENKYYFITVFEKIENKNGLLHTGATRCWGFYSNFDDADKVLRNNMTDLWETVYDYGIIEEFCEGISGYTGYREFYKYNQKKDIYEPIDEPKEFMHYASFAIG